MLSYKVRAWRRFAAGLDIAFYSLFLPFSTLKAYFAYDELIWKQDLTFHANCLLRTQLAWDVKSYFLGKIITLFENVVYRNFYPACVVKVILCQSDKWKIDTRNYVMTVILKRKDHGPWICSAFLDRLHWPVALSFTSQKIVHSTWNSKLLTCTGNACLRSKPIYLQIL